MIVDLHAHFAMHVVPRVRRGDLLTARGRRRWGEHICAAVVDVISRFDNYGGPGGTPGVTVTRLHKGGVRVVLSPLYLPFEEIKSATMPLEDRDSSSIVDQLEAVERKLRHEPKPWEAPDPEDHPRGVKPRVAHDFQQLEAARKAPDTVCFIHCVEGGFALGATPNEARANVEKLAKRGVAYVTVAHLFWCDVATNAPAIPIMSDACYRRLFPQPRGVGLSSTGEEAVRALLDNGVLVDITHMSDESLRGTFDVIEGWEKAHPDRMRRTVIASHAAARRAAPDGSLAYNLSDETLLQIIRRDGVVGLMACSHFMCDGTERPDTWQGTVDAMCKQIDHIAELSKAVMGGTTKRFDHVAIGSDLDGFAKPWLYGLEDAERLAALENALWSGTARPTPRRSAARTRCACSGTTGASDGGRNRWA